LLPLGPLLGVDLWAGFAFRVLHFMTLSFNADDLRRHPNPVDMAVCQIPAIRGFTAEPFDRH
jgi:hypothetical protein